MRDHRLRRLPAWVEYMLVLGKHIGMWTLVFASSVLLVAVLRSNRQRVQNA